MMVGSGSKLMVGSGSSQRQADMMVGSGSS